MIEKEVILDFPDNPSPPMQMLDAQFFEKTAEYSEELQLAIERLEKKVDHVYVLVNALSAGEYFGPNRNGDYFPEKELVKHHKTYEELGFQYQRHDNKDPKRSFGKVVFAWYNPQMRRVEIIVELPAQKNREVINKINAGQYPKTSMGCRVPYDVCSICGNKAKTRSQYCNHLKIYMGRLWNDGKRVYAINVNPKFFDNSWVDRPAEATAGVLAKVASLDEEKSADDKEAIIKKEIPVEVVSLESDPKNLLIRSRGKIPNKVLDKLASYEDGDLLTTLIAMRIAPLPDEFSKLGINDVTARANAPSEKIANDLRNLLSNLVLTKPIVLGNITKTADVVNDNISTEYVSFVSSFNDFDRTAVKTASEHPWLMKVWTGRDLGDLETQMLLVKESSAVKNMFIRVPQSFVTTGAYGNEETLPDFNKTAERLSGESLFFNNNIDSMNQMYNSLLNLEEN